MRGRHCDTKINNAKRDSEIMFFGPKATEEDLMAFICLGFEGFGWILISAEFLDELKGWQHLRK